MRARALKVKEKKYNIALFLLRNSMSTKCFDTNQTRTKITYEALFNAPLKWEGQNNNTISFETDEKKFFRVAARWWRGRKSAFAYVQSMYSNPTNVTSQKMYVSELKTGRKVSSLTSGDRKLHGEHNMNKELLLETFQDVICLNCLLALPLVKDWWWWITCWSRIFVK